MSTSKLAYQAPVLEHAASMVAATKANLTKQIESDLSHRDVFGAVGFGV